MARRVTRIRLAGGARSRPRRVVVIGAGLGGLSAACHLAGRGHDVTVLERDVRPGGCAGRFEAEGFRFDTGPTVLTMPDVLAQTLAAAGTDMRSVLDVRPLDPLYRACFADGSTVHLRRGRDAMRQEIAAVAGGRDAAAYDELCEWLTALHRVEMPHFIDRNYEGPLDIVRPLRPVLELLRLGGLGRLQARIDRTFTDPRLRRLFSFQTLYAGLAPHRALALFGVISFMDSVAGVYFPMGGMHAMATALAEAATAAGATIRCETAATRIVLGRGDEGPVRGVVVGDGAERAAAGDGDGERIPCDAVVCNADLPGAYTRLLPGLRPPRVVRRGRYAPSAVVWHAGVRGQPPAAAAHHNIHFGDAWDAAFRALIDDGRCMPDPSVLVTVPTVSDPALAPAGDSVVYALEPVPNLTGRVAWRDERARAHERLVARLATSGYPSDVVVERLVDLTDWAAAGMTHGTPFVLAHDLFQSGPFRPTNLERRAPGLVFVGAGTVPGIGVPLVLMSGRLAADRVEVL